MMRRWLLLALPLLAIGGPVRPQAETVDQALARARAESAAAEKRLGALESAASKAEGDAAQMRARQAAAGAAIEASEARIAAADAALALARGQVALREQRLAQRRAPLAALLAGLAVMGRKPPLLALADHGSVEELVRVRALLGTTMPVIRARSAALAADLKEGERLSAQAADARRALAGERQLLTERRLQFVALERRAAAQAVALSGKALLEGDRVLAGGEEVGTLGRSASADAAARANAGKIAATPLALPRPAGPDSPAPAPPLAYSLPLDAPVAEGLGAVSPIGVASRGLRLNAGRGAPLVVPANGTVAFAGPYRQFDGLVILDHGHGLVTLVTNVRPSVKRGERVARGAPLGSALGPVGVELRQRGTPLSPALIAGSSVPLSNADKSR